MSSAPLEPTLYALLPPTLLPSLQAHLSLLSIHIDSLNELNRVYHTSNPVIQGQLRNLLFRSTSTSTSTGGKGQASSESKGWKNSLAYTSAPLRGAEYADACVRAVIALDIPAGAGVEEGVDELDEFVNALGFEFSHSYHLQGHLFHIPIPAPISPLNPLTLHLSITRLIPLSSSEQDQPTGLDDIQLQRQQSFDENQPYLIQLKPSRPIQAVSSISTASGGGGDLGLADMIGYINEVASGIEVVNWTTNALGTGAGGSR
ncbi:hypothetical protein IAT40_000164 [Kwoniella sp. CBS 6097]